MCDRYYSYLREDIRMKNIKFLIIALIMVSMVVSLIACGSTTPASLKTSQSTAATNTADIKKPVTLKTLMFAQYYNRAGFQAVLKDLTAETGINLDITQVPDGEQGNIIYRTRFVTNDFPDIMFFYSGAGELKKYGNPEEIYLDQTNAEWTKNYDKEKWVISQAIDGVFYAAPFDGVLAVGTLYNKKVFSNLGISVPQSYKEFIAACEKIKAAGKIPLYISGKDGWTTMLPAWLAGSYGMTPDYIEKINTNKIKLKDNTIQKDSLVKLLDIKTKGYINKDFLSATWDNAQKALAKGDCAMYINLTNTMDSIVQKYPDKADDIGLFAFPYLGGGKDIVGTTGTNGLYAIKGKNQDAAQRFVDYFESIPVQNKFFEVQGGIPAIKGVTKTMLSRAELDGKALIDAGKALPMWGTGFKYSIGDFGALTQYLLAGGKTPEQVLDDVDKEFQKNAKAQKDPNFN